MAFFKLDSNSEKAKESFKSTPWAMKLFSDPNLRPIVNESRVIKNKTTDDTFVGRTLATDDTIRAWQSFWKPLDGETKVEEVISIISIGIGVNGHRDTAHGGFISLVLDEALGIAAETFRPAHQTTMTAYLKVDYKRPLKTPNVILCRASVERAEGKKLFVKGAIEDGNGGVFSTAEALFIILDRAKLRGLL